MLDPDNSAHAQQSLYQRLGGYDALAAFVSELMPRLRHDARLLERQVPRWAAARRQAAGRFPRFGFWRPRVLSGPRHEDLS